jgi:hypothetical protein
MDQQSRAAKAPPVINVEALVADLRSLRTLSEKDPVAAREALQRVVESVTLNPVGDEYGHTGPQKQHGRHRWRPCRR